MNDDEMIDDDVTLELMDESDEEIPDTVFIVEEEILFIHSSVIIA